MVFGVDDAIILAAAAAATAAAQAKAQADAAQKAKTLQNAAATERNKSIGTQQQMNQLQGILAEFQYDKTNATLDDAETKQLMARAELGVAAEELKAQRVSLTGAARRLSATVDATMESAQLQMLGFVQTEDEARRVVVQRSSTASMKAAEDLGTLDAVQADMGLSGTTLLAMGREIATTEGITIGDVVQGAKAAMDGVSLDRQKAGIVLASSLRELEGQSDQLASGGRQLDAAEIKQVTSGVNLDLQDRAITRERSAAGVDLQARKAGVSAQDTLLSSSAALNNIGVKEADLSASVAATNGIFSVVNSGLQVGTSYVTGQQRLQALKAGQLAIQNNTRGG